MCIIYADKYPDKHTCMYIYIYVYIYIYIYIYVDFFGFCYVYKRLSILLYASLWMLLLLFSLEGLFINNGQVLLCSSHSP